MIYRGVLNVIFNKKKKNVDYCIIIEIKKENVNVIGF